MQLFAAHALDLLDDVLTIDLIVDPLAGRDPAQQRRLLLRPGQDGLLVKVGHGSPFLDAVALQSAGQGQLVGHGADAAACDARYALIRQRLEQKRRVERVALIGMPQCAHTRPARASARLAVRTALMSW